MMIVMTHQTPRTLMCYEVYKFYEVLIGICHVHCGQSFDFSGELEIHTEMAL